MKELTPFSMTAGTIAPAEERDLSQAVELTPMVRFGILLPGAPLTPAAPNQSPNHQVQPEMQADADPKAASSSVTDSASPSPSGTVESGQNSTEQMEPIHPSTLSVNSETIVPAEKVTSLLLPPQTTIG